MRGDSHGNLGEGGEVDPVAPIRWKIESMQRAQVDGDVENGLVLTGQVASAIHDMIHIADFVPAMAAEAAGILRRLGASVS